MPDPVTSLSAVEMQAAIRSGELTSVQIATACIERIASRDDLIKAWAWFDPGHVIDQARALDDIRADKRGMLHGIPVGVKDVIDTFDMPTQMGSPIYAGYRPNADASCVAMLRAAGALILGKTKTCEFAAVEPADTVNPHNPAHTPGGSSSGSAAAVADFMVPLALGTQTGGSIQRPASYCGIAGYKPSFGLINRAGLKLASESLDTIGWLGRSVEDIELVTRALVRMQPVEWLEEDRRLVIGLCRTPDWDRAKPETHHAVLDAASRLEALGHDVREIVLPQSFSELGRTRATINDYERARALAHEWRTAGAAISSGLRRTITRGQQITAESFEAALMHLAACRSELDGLFAGIDAFLCPTVAGEAEKGLSHTGDHEFQSIWTQLRTPAVSLPTHKGPNGLPVGIQVIGRQHADGPLLAAAQLIFRQLGQGPRVTI